MKSSRGTILCLDCTWGLVKHAVFLKPTFHKEDLWGDSWVAPVAHGVIRNVLWTTFKRLDHKAYSTCVETLQIRRKKSIESEDISLFPHCSGNLSLKKLSRKMLTFVKEKFNNNTLLFTYLVLLSLREWLSSKKRQQAKYFIFKYCLSEVVSDYTANNLKRNQPHSLNCQSPSVPTSSTCSMFHGEGIP